MESPLIGKLTRTMSSGVTSKGSEAAEAVAELITDIEGEARLHLARVQEFLDGTKEYDAITEPRERATLILTSQALESFLSDLSALTPS